MKFKDRFQAGRFLASKLVHYQDQRDVLVLALPRGGVPVGYEVSLSLNAPFDAIAVRKIGLPGYREFGIGAIASGGVEQIQPGVAQQYGVTEASLQEVLEEERGELAWREKCFRGNRPLPYAHGKTVILIDDGWATGSTMKAAIASVRPQKPERIVAASPVGAMEACRELLGLADEVVCAHVPVHFEAVRLWYVDFNPPTDEEVRRLLHHAPGVQVTLPL